MSKNQFNIKGSFLTLLYTAIDKNPDMTLGEIIYSFTNKKSLQKQTVEATDEELYTSLEEFVKNYDPSDEPMEEQQFIFWIQQATVVR